MSLLTMFRGVVRRVSQPSVATPRMPDCDCDPNYEEYCDAGWGLVRLYDRAVRVLHQYRDRIPINHAVTALATHWGWERGDTNRALAYRTCQPSTGRRIP